jgi:[ribosomal protein S5]-alanine N-acetyltransferase
MVIAETPRLILRHVQLGDAAAMQAVFGDAEVMRYSEGVRPPQWVRSWLTEWLTEYYPRWGFGSWAVLDKRTTSVIGYCGISRFPGRCTEVEAEIGFRLARAYWGCGLATEAATAVRNHAFHALHLPRLVALIDPANVASVRVAEKVGLRYERDVMLPGYDHPDHFYALDRV